MVRKWLAALAAGVGLAGPAAAQTVPASEPLALPTATSGVTTEVVSEPAYAGYIGGGDIISTPRVWGTAEYLLWWVAPANSPPLITAVPGVVVGTGGGGMLPDGASAVVFPTGRQVEFGAHSGGRWTLGADFNDCFGFDISGFVLETRSKGAAGISDGTVLAFAQPYIEAMSGVQQNLYVSLPGQYVGAATAVIDTQLWGMDVNARTRWYGLLSSRNDATAGFRYLALDESIQATGLAYFPDGTYQGNNDVIRTSNRFYGGQVGIASRFGSLARGFGVETNYKLAMGGVHQRAELSGANSYLRPGQPIDTEFVGLYARPANLGVFDRTMFAAVSDLAVNLTYNFSPAAQVFFGYSIIYITNVLRPGEVVDPVLNGENIRFNAEDVAPTGVIAPRNRLEGHDFWAQGLNFGFKFQY